MSSNHPIGCWVLRRASSKTHEDGCVYPWPVSSWYCRNFVVLIVALDTRGNGFLR